MYTAYLFDLYGTLADIHTDEINPLLWNRMADHFRTSGMKVDGQRLKELYFAEVNHQAAIVKQYRKYPGINILDVFWQLAVQLQGIPSPTWTLETAQRFRTLSTRYLTLYDGVIEVLESLREQGKRTFLVADGQQAYVSSELQTLGIAHLFSGVTVSSSIRVSKPDPRLVKQLAETYRIDLSSSLLVGNDPTEDYELAKQHGFDFCYFYSGTPEYKSVDYQYFIADGDLRGIPGWRKSAVQP